jgi:hypothetical protein
MLLNHMGLNPAWVSSPRATKDALVTGTRSGWTFSVECGRYLDRSSAAQKENGPSTRGGTAPVGPSPQGFSPLVKALSAVRARNGAYRTVIQV